MLAVTSQAASVIDDILSADDELPDEAGMRITKKARKADIAEGRAQEPTLRLEVVEAPKDGDEVLQDAPVFLEPEAASLLDDKLLDADLSGELVHFALKEQS